MRLFRLPVMSPTRPEMLIACMDDVSGLPAQHAACSSWRCGCDEVLPSAAHSLPYAQTHSGRGWYMAPECHDGLAMRLYRGNGGPGTDRSYQAEKIANILAL
jgi:hypothetical protein